MEIIHFQSMLSRVGEEHLDVAAFHFVAQQHLYLIFISATAYF